MKRVFSNCPRCDAELRPALSFAGTESEFWLECTECNTFVNTYIPQPHQAAVHEDPHTFIGNFGAYGTGKTLTSREEVMKHCFLTSKANVLIGANVTSQYEQTIKRELEHDLPARFVADSSVQKSYIDLINGARIMFRPFDDPEKLRSYNLTMFVMVEASEINPEAFHQLKTRLRNLNASVQARDETGEPLFRVNPNDPRGVELPVIERDWLRGIVESNPDSGWIRTDILLNAHQITKHGRVVDEYLQEEEKKDPAIGVHVASTDVNAYLPPSFIPNLVKNKPGWWVARFVYSSFSYAEGLVYPSAMKHVVPTFNIPQEWKRIMAFDYGLADDAVYLWGAIDEREGILYIYKEQRVNNMDIRALAQLFRDGAADIPYGGWICPPIIDPRSASKRDYNKESLADLFLEEGIIFEPGYVNIDARVLRTNTYFESGRLKIMDCCVGTIRELKEYKFPPRALSRDVAYDKPEDKNNHGINPLEWICMRLPADPANIRYGVYNKAGQDITRQQESIQKLPFALQDPYQSAGELAYEMPNFLRNF